MINRKYIDARKRVWAREKDAAVQQVRHDRAAKRAGVLGLTAVQIIMRDQLAARVAADTAAALAAHQQAMSDEPPPPPDPFGPLTKLLRGEKT